MKLAIAAASRDAGQVDEDGMEDHDEAGFEAGLRVDDGVGPGDSEAPTRGPTGGQATSSVRMSLLLQMNGVVLV